METKTRFEKGEIARIVLGAVAMVGLMSVAVAVPNAVQIIQLIKKANRRHRSPSYVRGIIGKLHKNSLICFEKQQGKSYIRLTARGELELLRKRTGAEKKAKKKWDGKWRIMAFDVKERKRGVRDRLRSDIVNFGFVRLQDSVWVYPYDCEDLIVLLKADYKIGQEVLYLLVEKIENDTWLRKKFGLYF